MDKLRLVLIITVSLVLAYGLHLATIGRQLRGSLDLQATVPVSSVAPVSRALRPIYPYSVIPGGAFTPAELDFAVRHDPIVRDHYTGFNVRSARLVLLTEDRLEYVSYRLKNRIYWTRNRLRIPRGETLLTDGANFARTRCGNRLSSQSKSQVAVEQPNLRLLSLPPFSLALLARGEVKLASPPLIDVPAASGPLLAFDLPRLAPYAPNSTLGPGLPAASTALPLASYPLAPAGLGVAPRLPTAPSFNGGSPPVSALLPATPGAPIISTSPISAIPEPGSLCLFAGTLAGLFWLLARILRKEKSATR